MFDGWEQREANGAYVWWRANGGTQMSASLIYAGQRPACCPQITIPVYQGGGTSGLQGIVFRPGVSTKVLCASGGDMSGANCNKWTWMPQNIGRELRKSCKTQRETQAPWDGNHYYNEFKVDGRHWGSHLPDTIEAFFGTTALARQQHGEFLRTYGLTAAQVPLLSFNPSNWDAPFA